MKITNASNIELTENWRILIYGKPGIGKTTLIKQLKGKTLVLSLDTFCHSSIISTSQANFCFLTLLCKALSVMQITSKSLSNPNFLTVSFQPSKIATRLLTTITLSALLALQIDKAQMVFPLPSASQSFKKNTVI